MFSRPFKKDIQNLRLEFFGKTAVIIGGATGIGYEISKFLLKQGANVVLADINVNTDKIAKNIGKEKAIGISGDICDYSYRKKIIERSVAVFSRIDILINCASISLFEGTKSIKKEFWAKIIDINLSANFFMAEEVGKYMMNNNIEGSIINIASKARSIVSNKYTAYYLSKSTIISSMTNVLAMKLIEYGICVNTISPNIIINELMRKTWYNEFDGLLNEIIYVIRFLCINSPLIITGHNILINRCN